MKIGIVGSEEAKFTEKGKERARSAITILLDSPNIEYVVSGHCHLGGIDIWAEQIGQELGKLDPNLIFPPRVQSWEGGYKPRNLQIARNSDKVVCITVDKLPPDYSGMKFSYCYHCIKVGRSGTDHVKSGGCWTAIQAQKMGKQAEWIVIEN